MLMLHHFSLGHFLCEATNDPFGRRSNGTELAWFPLEVVQASIRVAGVTRKMFCRLATLQVLRLFVSRVIWSMGVGCWKL